MFLIGPIVVAGHLSKNIETILLACIGIAATGFFIVTDCPAADLPVVVSPAPLKARPTVNYDWSGFYVGGHVGYGRGYGHDTLSDPGPSAADSSFGSLSGGMQFGYNYRLPSRLLVGIEGDISFPSYLDDGIVGSRTTPSSAVAEKLDFVSTVRGRAGYAFDRWLFYATGGLAWSQARFLEDSNLTGNEDKVLRMRAGWALGAGAEVAIAPGWSARLEYLYDHLGKASGTFPSGAGYESTTVDLNNLRLGLDRKLDWTGEATSSRDVSDPRAIDPISWNVHGQLTFIEQGYPAFRSPYQGTNSLTGANQIQNTTSATAFVGYRPWDGTEIYINPELMQGFGLNNTLGVAGFPNGEAQKSNFPIPRIDIARVFVRQTFGLGGEQETVEDGPNQLAGKQDISRITVTAGRFAVLDIFEGNTYSHDPRVDFLNWNMYCCGSYDVTMDKIGFTWGAAVELNQKSWAFRTGYFLVPVVSNVNSYDTHILERGEYIGELELRYSLFAQPGKLRLMGWADIANMGSYAEALAMPVTTPNYPDITQTRQVRTNYGFVANMEQAITGDLGIFSRASWSPGLVEIIGWTDCDESLSFGTVLKGNAWGRPDDRIGVAGVVEGLSPTARAFFAAGGLGILIGDGRLNYRPEQILEAYYAYSLNTWATLTFDYQFIDNPGYNADRGPVSVFSGRLHAQF
ncbi:carbohydrate porin [Bradyrhizobium sp.]|jgi:high affinity Mn2+ porin|uniref:carbohydrate porin n=1 Tax=Bradyrhizobium sp. TaxID=376 RepID=UPI003C153A6B